MPDETPYLTTIENAINFLAEVERTCKGNNFTDRAGWGSMAARHKVELTKLLIESAESVGGDASILNI